MFRKYGLVGLFMVLLGGIGIFFSIRPILVWLFPIFWWGYILLIDALVYKLQRNSLIMNRKKTFFLIVFLSIIFWWVFELFNQRYYSYWVYLTSFTPPLSHIVSSICFATVLPAIFETANFLRIFYHYERYERPLYGKRIHKKILFAIIVTGIIFMLFPFFSPTSYLALLGWVGIFLILDPVNYLHNEPSMIRYIKRGHLKIPLSFFFGGYIAGFLWEFWNYYAETKWIYRIPFNLGPKLFEMPLLGYIPYGFFAFEIFSMYYFSRFLKKEAVIIERKIKKKRS